MQKRGCVVLIAMALYGCGPDITTPLNETTAVKSLQASPADAYSVAARRLSAALSSVRVRQALLGDLRKSHVSEHKVDLKNWLEGAKGYLVNKNFPEVGDSLLSSLADLPPTDVYVVGHRSRTHWKATEPLMVAGTADQDNQSVVAWGVDGTRIELNAKTIEDTPVLLLQPAEVHGDLIAPQREDINAPTIQDENESDVGIVHLTAEQKKTRRNARSIALFKLESPASLRSATGSRASVPTPGRVSKLMDTYDYNMYGDSFETESHSVDEIGGAEVEFSGTGYVEGSLLVTGVERQVTSFFHTEFGPIPQEFVNNTGILFGLSNGIEFNEIDNGFNDDYIGQSYNNSSIVTEDPVLHIELGVGGYEMDWTSISNLPPLFSSNSTDVTPKATPIMI